MTIKSMLCVAVSSLVLGSGALFAQPAPGAAAGNKAESNKDRKERPLRPERETPEMKEARVKAYQSRVDAIKLLVKEGKMEKERGEYLLKFLAVEKAFKDANPEWVKYGFHDRAAPQGKGDGKQAPRDLMYRHGGPMRFPINPGAEPAK